MSLVKSSSMTRLRQEVFGTVQVYPTHVMLNDANHRIRETDVGRQGPPSLFLWF
jgi:hypothetical protein